MLVSHNGSSRRGKGFGGDGWLFKDAIENVGPAVSVFASASWADQQLDDHGVPIPSSHIQQ